MRIVLFLLALLAAAPARAETLTDLAWMRGCWRTTGDGPVITEVWTTPPIPAMFGYAYTIGEGEVQGWEHTRIEMNSDGRPQFVAMPGGGAPVAFQIVEDDAPNRVAFENPAHDFPKRVEYWREGDILFARVSTGDEGMDFRYRRIRCPAALKP